MITHHVHSAGDTLGPLAPRGFWAAGLVGIVALAAGVVLGLAEGDDLAYFYHSYLLSFCFCLSITVGAQFFVAFQHVSRAGWSVTVRRLCELFGATTPVLTLLFLPILATVCLHRASLYEWADAQATSRDALLQHKAAYLDPAFFIVRSLGYFAVWWLLGRFFLQRSLRQDQSGDVALTLQAERLSPLALLLLSVTVTFAAIDWLMSLEPRWFSTIYGLYYFSGAMVAILAALILAAIGLQAAGRLGDLVTIEHYHDLGKYLFGFVIFWAYIAFSQYLLIWYADIPEETVWYIARQAGAWKWVSLALLFGHFVIPLFGLLSREVKRRKLLLGFWAVWLLAFHWLDLYWLVMPSLGPDRRPTLSPIDACCLLGVGGIYLAGLFRIAGQQPLVPVKDPRLGESVAFENV